MDHDDDHLDLVSREVNGREPTKNITNGTSSGAGHFAALILARGGSKEIPLKNLVKLRGKPLLSWALEAILRFAGFDSVWVSTDHELIEEEALRHEGVSVFHRSKEFAQVC